MSVKNITVIGDPHLKKSNLELMAQLTQKVEKLNYPSIWLGDLLDQKSVIQGECLNFWMYYFSGSSLQHYILVGNHDYFNLKSQEHSLQVLKDLPNVTVISGPRRLEVNQKNLDFIPYIHLDHNLKRTLKIVPKDATLFCHASITGFDYGTGMIHKGEVGLGGFKKCKRVISGHFHKHQQKGNLTYLGTPFSHSFGETDQEKFLGIYNVDTDHLELIPTGLPQHRTLTIDCDNPNSLPNQITHFKGFPAHDIWRVILTGNSENVNEVKLPKSILDQNPKIIKRPSELREVANSISETTTPHQQFQEWGSNVKELNADTLKLGLSILEEVK